MIVMDYFDWKDTYIPLVEDVDNNYVRGLQKNTIWSRFDNILVNGFKDDADSYSVTIEQWKQGEEIEVEL
jgi:hypothetical protein